MRLWQVAADVPAGFAEHRSGLLVPQELAKPRPPIGIDLFAGAGGFSLGMEWGGIEVPVAVEWDVAAAATYAYNLGKPGGRFVLADAEAELAFARYLAGARRRQARRPKGDEPRGPEFGEPGWFGSNRPMLARGREPREEASAWVNKLNGGDKLTGEGCRALIIGDIRGLSGADILAAGEIEEEEEVQVVFGGPPCQGFSLAGRQDPADPRNNLILEFLRIVEEIQPRCFVMENVPPLISQRKFLPLWEAYQARAHWALTSPIEGEGSNMLRHLEEMDVEDEEGEEIPPPLQGNLFELAKDSGGGG